MVIIAEGDTAWPVKVVQVGFRDWKILQYNPYVAYPEEIPTIPLVVTSAKPDQPDLKTACHCDPIL